MLNSNKDVYERIEDLCKKEHITCAELLRNIGVSKSTLTELKKGRSNSLSAKVSKKIADYFNVSVDYIMTGENSESKPSVTDEDLKIALFGGDEEVTDEMWEEAVEFARFIIEREKKRKEKE